MSVKGNSQKSVGKGKTLMFVSNEVSEVREDSIVKGRGCGRGSRVAGGGVGRHGSGRVGRSRSKQLDPSENCTVDVLESRRSTMAPTKSSTDSTVVTEESCDSIDDTASHQSDGRESQADDTQACDTQEDGTQTGETRAGGNQDTGSRSKTKRPRSRIVVISEEAQEQIREFLMANDFLYNKSRDQWRDTPARDKKWEELGELLGRDARDMKQWYQSTRSKLSDIKNKKVTPSGSGFDVEGVTDKARRLWERFQFLLPHVGEVKSRTVRSLKQKREARLHVQLPSLDDEGQADQAPHTQEDADDAPMAAASLERQDDILTTSGASTFASSDQVPDIRNPPARDTKRTTTTSTVPDEGVQALVQCSRQLMEVGERLAKYLRPESTPQERQRQHFAEMSGNILQKLPEDLYREASDRIWTVLQEVQRKAQARRYTSAPYPPQAPVAGSSRSYQQPQWQPDPAQWTSNPPPASVWGSMENEYIRQSNPGYLQPQSDMRQSTSDTCNQRQQRELHTPQQSLHEDICKASMIAGGIPTFSQDEEDTMDS